MHFKNKIFFLGESRLIFDTPPDEPDGAAASATPETRFFDRVAPAERGHLGEPVEFEHDFHVSAGELTRRSDAIRNAVGRVLAPEQTPVNAAQLVETMHGLIANQPAALLLEALRNAGQLEQVSATLAPYCMGELKRYVELKGHPECGNFVEYLGLTHEEQFLVALLYVKDVGTAEHTMDLYMIAIEAMEKIPALERITDEQKRILLRDCLLHDTGKVNLPDIVLHNPVRRHKDKPSDFAHEDVLRAYLLEPERRNEPIDPPFELTDDERGYFSLLLIHGSAGLQDAEKVADDFIALCKTQKADVRAMVPIRYLLRATDNTLNHRDTVNPAIVEEVEKQHPALAQANTILALYGLDPKLSLPEAIEAHESGSLDAVADANREIVEAQGVDEDTIAAKRMLARVLYGLIHHNYESTLKHTSRLRIMDDNPAPPEDDVLHKAITIIDMIAALSSAKRSYRDPATAERIARIIRENVEAGYGDSAMAEQFIRIMLNVTPYQKTFDALRDTTITQFPELLERLQTGVNENIKRSARVDALSAISKALRTAEGKSEVFINYFMRVLENNLAALITLIEAVTLNNPRLFRVAMQDIEADVMTMLRQVNAEITGTGGAAA